MSNSSYDPPRAKAAELPPVDLNPRTDPPLDFPDRALGELTASDYAELGFMCGLEVHQQLITASKLFCRCPAGRRATRVDTELLRHMRPTLSELGQYDGCALMEFKTRKEIVYQLQRGTVCTYEMDDTPPFPIDEEAVKLALAISKAFDLNLVSELQVMRKQYLDGSIPTGFQRTAMIGVGGVIPFADSELGGGELRIRQLTLEEDSCREVRDHGHRITFLTDRLGIPLIETVTEPDLSTPRDVEAGGRLLARVARSSRAVRRGAGAARQDVNVSVAGSRRVELKGVATHRALPLLVHNEAYRHLNLLRVRAELSRRGLDRDALSIPDRGIPWEVSELCVEVRSVLGGCRFEPIERAIDRGDSVCAVRLPGFAGLPSHATQPNRTFAHELAERVRVIACPVHAPFLIDSDNDAERLPEATWRQLRAAVRATADDAVVVCWAEPRDAMTAAREVLARCAEAFIGVPSETRQAHRDGSTGFERILPGPERMYPDTDTPPLPIPDAWVESIELGEAPWSRERRYRELGLSAAAARRLLEAPWADLFDELDPNTEAASPLAVAFEQRLVHFWREAGHRDLPAADRLEPLVRSVERGGLDLDGFNTVFDRLIRETGSPAAIVAEHGTDPGRLGAALAAAAAATAEIHDPDKAFRFGLGRAMATAPRGALDPELVAAKLRERLEAKT